MERGNEKREADFTSGAQHEVPETEDVGLPFGILSPVSSFPIEDTGRSPAAGKPVQSLICHCEVPVPHTAKR